MLAIMLRRHTSHRLQSKLLHKSRRNDCFRGLGTRGLGAAAKLQLIPA